MVEQMNRVLHESYTQALERWKGMETAPHSVSRPLLLQVPAAYTLAPWKLLVVGQETQGWGEDRTLDAASLMRGYADWNLGESYRSTPFWRAAHELYGHLNPGAPERGFLWSNLVKVDQSGRRPQPSVEDSIGSLNLLQREIAVIQPDVVMFFTGPMYDARLRATFPELQYGPALGRQPTRVAARLEHPDLPKHSYRTYHPAYLQRSHNWSVIEQLATLVQPA